MVASTGRCWHTLLQSFGIPWLLWHWSQTGIQVCFFVYPNPTCHTLHLFLPIGKKKLVRSFFAVQPPSSLISEEIIYRWRSIAGIIMNNHEQSWIIYRFQPFEHDFHDCLFTFIYLLGPSSFAVFFPHGHVSAAGTCRAFWGAIGNPKPTHPNARDVLWYMIRMLTKDTLFLIADEGAIRSVVRQVALLCGMLLIIIPTKPGSSSRHIPTIWVDFAPSELRPVGDELPKHSPWFQASGEQWGDYNLARAIVTCKKKIRFFFSHLASGKASSNWSSQLQCYFCQKRMLFYSIYSIPVYPCISMYIPFKRYKISVNPHIFSSNDNDYELWGAEDSRKKWKKQLAKPQSMDLLR